ncbi:lipopolysaccharide biosynthesis protein [Natrononativus amylolyticus]|uniref:lipopolysaccharide biosynthesis protein n=1 Tax=Natrononativus amylolyticus TaxID=2963434 RepID=UPI0020CB82C0|nr:polysaccharide biosynthesis C-terminal domain-containing protein [Natrononativus amylolyticus]
MRIGQTSFLQFVAEIAASAIGFVATIYFARILGPEILGYYAVALAVVTGLGIGGNIGLSSAITKRMSEGEEPNAYFWAGASIILSLFLVLAIGVLAFHEQVNAYIGADVHWLIVFMLLASLCYSLFNAALKGRHLVHVYAVLKPLKIGGRAVVQIALVLAGLELTGMLIGYSTGWVMAAAVAVVVLTPRFERPSRRHYAKLLEFAKYSWLGRVQGKTFSEADILILGALVSSALVGIYSIAWALCSFFLIFAHAISTAMFPEISKQSARGESGRIARLTTDALAFAGFVLIPGAVGGILVGDRVLAVYGAEFVEGQAVLPILLFGSLLYAYLDQLLNTLNGIDRPDVAFRVNGLFIGTNVVANVALVYAFGWVGAAVGTALSAAVGLVAAFWLIRRRLAFELPVAEIGRQWAAALLMAAAVYPATLLAGPPAETLPAAIVTVVIVGIGAAVYTVALLAMSARFRTVVRENVPVDLPRVAGR